MFKLQFIITNIIEYCRIKVFVRTLSVAMSSVIQYCYSSQCVVGIVFYLLCLKFCAPYTDVGVVSIWVLYTTRYDVTKVIKFMFKGQV